MNRQRLLRVAEAIERANFLDMAHTFARDAGNSRPSCIAGYAIDCAYRDSGAIEEAAIWLDLTRQEASDLLTPETLDVSWRAGPGDHDWITPSMAVETIRRFAETGRVVWVGGCE